MYHNVSARDECSEGKDTALCKIKCGWVWWFTKSSQKGLSDKLKDVRVRISGLEMTSPTLFEFIVNLWSLEYGSKLINERRTFFDGIVSTHFFFFFFFDILKSSLCRKRAQYDGRAGLWLLIALSSHSGSSPYWLDGRASDVTSLKHENGNACLIAPSTVPAPLCLLSQEWQYLLLETEIWGNET